MNMNAKDSRRSQKIGKQCGTGFLDNVVFYYLCITYAWEFEEHFDNHSPTCMC